MRGDATVWGGAAAREGGEITEEENVTSKEVMTSSGPVTVKGRIFGQKGLASILQAVIPLSAMLPGATQATPALFATPTSTTPRTVPVGGTANSAAEKAVAAVVTTNAAEGAGRRFLETYDRSGRKDFEIRRRKQRRPERETRYGDGRKGGLK